MSEKQNPGEKNMEKLEKVEVERICSWCGEVMGRKVIFFQKGESLGFTKTHGMCVPCFKKQMKQLDKMRGN